MTVFISYRRSDTQQAAGRLADRLTERFGSDAVAIDVTTNQVGRDYRSVIFDAIEHADVVLALIGQRFFAEGPDGSPRLVNPDDPLRLELSHALARRGVPVIPVLVDGAELPPRDSLPEDVQALTFRGAIELAHQRFDRDYEYLESQVARFLEPDAPQPVADAVPAHRAGSGAEAAPRPIPPPPVADRTATTGADTGPPPPRAVPRATPREGAHRKHWTGIALVVLILVGAAGLIVAVVLSSDESDEPSDRDSTSPLVLPPPDEIYQQPPDEAVARLEAVGLEVVVESSGCSESTPAGLVRQLTLGTELNQRILYGKSTDAIDDQAVTDVRPGDLVTVWVSEGPC